MFALYLTAVLVPLSAAAPPILQEFVPQIATRGSHYDFGFVLGSTFRARVVEQLAYDTAPLVPYATTFRGAALVAQLTRSTAEWFPSYADELRGLAAGADVPFATVMLSALQVELNLAIGGAKVVNLHLSALVNRTPAVPRASIHIDADNLVDTVIRDLDSIRRWVESVLPSASRDVAVGRRRGGRVTLGCSDVLARGVDGAVLAHNEDNDRIDKSTAFIVTASFRPPALAAATSPRAAPLVRGPKAVSATEGGFQAFAYAGALPGWAFGVTSAGVALSVNALYPPLVDAAGAPTSMLCRHTLGATSVGDAFARAVVRPAASGFNVNGVGRSGHMFGMDRSARRLARGAAEDVAVGNVEVAPAPYAPSRWTVTAPGGHAFHFNVYTRLNASSGPALSSVHRRAAAERVWPLSEVNASATVADVVHRAVRVLGDTSDTDWPIYRTGASAKDDNATTAATALFVVRSTGATGGWQPQGVWHLYRGNPATTAPLLTLPIGTLED
eukprot:TRINITY_DN72908_c0_g1_i1.p1 TRINITY_DN72908_c0_g1~~TRINITY_DN72908_c0_g1_i1.p1  ORF type:complete len:501 (+),score=82.97 TRINITY_DN72908_c0_g1_i1:86-1588(+)